MEQLFEYFKRKLSETPIDLIRYKYGEIEWGGHALGLVGPRGVGKSTMLLQYIKMRLDVKDTLYVSADHLYFSSHTLVDTADRFYKMGGKHLFIDEIHKYEGWSTEVKQMFDSYSDLQLVISGSSILEITKGMADLSRRVPIYEMQGLSFREYLHLFHGIKMEAIGVEQLLRHDYNIPGVEHPLPLFNDYLRRGYYPFGRDVAYDIELMQVVAQTMESDIPIYLNANASIGRKLKQLLMVVAESVPFKPVMQKLADVTGINRNYIQDYLMYMERAGMIAQLRDAVGGIRGLGKTEKVYLDNTNLIYVLAPKRADIGNVRETFFMNQMRVVGDVMCSPVSDFLVDGMTFEIGGRKKGQKQISDVKNGYVVKDDIEAGYANVLPLWAFGLLY
ncbi:MAG: AAA family ATPase [Prevotellaceae bacterium]|nr:AAA family ATPase [Prevotella sp.]MDD5876794.1 AAA family ATPase [Prevotellaceae bacterium]MDD7421175.1 AAA family ATPase [Prevotellaceae bacterium]MDY5946243.1 AAA family ATPase [Prevotella sp.]